MQGTTASHERVHSRRTDHPLTASAYARRAELQHDSPARRRNQHSAAPPAANHATDAFVAQLELQQANQWQDAQRQQQQATAERLLPPPLRQQQTQRHLQEQQRISREERLQYYESEQRLMQLQEQFHITDNQSLTQPPALRRNLHHDFDPNSDTHQGYAPPAQQYLRQQPHLRPAQPPKAPHVPHLPYHSTFQHEQTTYPASNAPKHRELSYPPPQDYAADPIIYPQPTCSQPLSEHPNSAIPSREYSDLVLQAEKLSLLGYFNTSATDREIASHRHLSTEMTPIEDSPTKPGTDAASFQLAQDHTGDQAEIPKTENVVYCQDAHLKPSNNPVPEGRHSPSKHQVFAFARFTEDQILIVATNMKDRTDGNQYGKGCDVELDLKVAWEHLPDSFTTGAAPSAFYTAVDSFTGREHTGEVCTLEKLWPVQVQPQRQIGV
ncbi:Starch synthase [Gracilaria domingensis]|nr:Starch synthase [Gracilaria domingensis]